MIKTDKIIINKRGLRNLKHYENLGYDISGDSFIIDIKHLSGGSKKKIDVICDVCEVGNNLTYKDYNRFNIYPNYVCKICKRKQTNLERYGVVNVFESDEIKDAIKKTNLEKHGVVNYAQSVEYKIKSKQTNLGKYGVVNVFESDEIKNKIKQNNIDKYGVEYYSQTTECKIKVRDTNISRYGGFTLQSDELLKKVKQTNLERYGFECPNKSDIIKNKTKKTFNEKYGGFTLQSDELLKKVKQTNLERYGFEYYQSTDDYVINMKKTCSSRYGVDNIFKNEEYRVGNFDMCNDNNYIEYISNGVSLFSCDKHKNHNFEIRSTNYHDRKNHNIPLCTICNPIGDSVSIKEKELFEYISSIYDGEVIQSYRDGLEIDIYLPGLNIGFEFNGLYWHSEKYKDKNYHLNKTNHFKDRGIRIIHIWEDDWVNNTDILKSQIRNWLGIVGNRIYARKCEVRVIDDGKITKEFINNNHIQGNSPSIIKLGLYNESNLVSIMTFNKFEGRKKMSDSEWNLNRFCNKLDTSVIGGGSKLLKFFIKNYNTKRIISYADKTWSIGNFYTNLRFTCVNHTTVDYKYVVNNVRIHKSRYRKSNTGVSESTLTIPRVYDCGKLKFELNI